MRQTFLGLTGAVLLTCAPGLLAPRPATAAEETPAETLRALRLVEKARGDGMTEEDVRKLDAAYRELVERHPDESEVRNAYAAFLFDHGSPDAAVGLWAQTLERDPENAEAAFQLGHAHLQRGDAAAALRDLERASVSPHATAFHIYSFANALYLFRREAAGRSPEAALEQALREFGRAAQLEPANLEYARGYAETFFALPQPDWTEALLAWQRVVTLTPETNPARSFYLLQAARSALNAEDPETATALLDQLPPDSAGKAAEKLRARIKAERQR